MRSPPGSGHVGRPQRGAWDPRRGHPAPASGRMDRGAAERALTEGPPRERALPAAGVPNNRLE